MPSNEDRLEKVLQQLDRYEHPLFNWTATADDRGVEVKVTVKSSEMELDPYIFHLTERDIYAKSFQWDFQRLLYNYLHDYLVDLFTKSPHIRD